MGRSTRSRGAALLALVLIAATGCYRNPEGGPGPNGSGNGNGQGSRTAVGATRNALESYDDPLGGKVTKVVYLEQNWSPTDSRRFYFTTQGTELLPYSWFLALEQPEAEAPFRSNAHLLTFRYLPQQADDQNPDGLPVGFVKDEGPGRPWLGLTCAACHTGELRYKGVAYRIDGGPSLADLPALTRALVLALRNTRDQDAKFDRFAKQVLGPDDSSDQRAKLKDDMAVVIKRRDDYNRRNFPVDAPGGFGRVDAFGAILNQVYHEAARLGGRDDDPDPLDNTKAADAPVSYPFLWDAPQHDRVQWVGNARNGGIGDIGALGRNVGEVLGVFADFEIPESPGVLGYRSSVRVQALRDIEDWLRTLWSPRWPADFPKIDASLATRGEGLYKRLCLDCHKAIDRTDPDRTIVAQMKSTGTDPRTADNFFGRTGRAGKLDGSWSKFFPLVGSRLESEAGGEDMLVNAVIGTIVGNWRDAPEDTLKSIDLAARSIMAPAAPGVDLGPPYKARPLNGIWATAPYLHNGSVPSLAQLLLPAAERVPRFRVGNREFDPAEVGYDYKAENPAYFEFRTRDEAGDSIPGNSNRGHDFAKDLTPDERKQLLEYLKTL